MAANAILTVTGKKQGSIKGSVTQKGREGAIAVFAVEHEVLTPRDAASGQATGKRQHKLLQLTKETDKSTPLLFKALVTNEALTEVTLKFFSPEASGTETNTYTIKLTNASIASTHTQMLNNKAEPGSRLPLMEAVSFAYQKIEWIWTDGGISASDDWQLAL